jgi:hypothetical protein
VGAVPCRFELAQLIVDVKSQEGTSGAVVELETSWDMDTGSLVPMTALTTGTPIVSIRNITSGVGPLVRLKLTGVAGVQSVVNMNIYLTPKNARSERCPDVAWESWRSCESTPALTTRPSDRRRMCKLLDSLVQWRLERVEIRANNGVSRVASNWAPIDLRAQQRCSR